MSDKRLFLVCTIALSCALAPGCTCAMEGTQQVDLAVARSASNEGVADAIVTIAPSQAPSQNGFGWINCNELTPEECLDTYADRRSSPSPPSSFGTYVASTTVDGRVTLIVDSDTVCTGSGRPFDFDPCAPGLLDQVTGVDFYVRVEKDGSSEILTVEFTPGNTISGEFFEVTVVSIGEPVLVEDVD